MTTTVAPAPNAPTTGLDHVLELPFTTAIRAAAALLAVIPTSDASPVITAAHFDGAAMLGTDRYRVVKVSLPTAPAEINDRLVLGEAFLISRDALTWISKLKRDKDKAKVKLATMSDAGYTVRITHTELALAVELVDQHGQAEQFESFPAVEGTFPPVTRLLDSWKPSEDNTATNFDPKLFAPLVAFCARHSSTGGFGIQFGVRETNKLAPARIQCGDVTFLIVPLVAR